MQGEGELGCGPSFRDVVSSGSVQRPASSVVFLSRFVVCCRTSRSLRARRGSEGRELRLQVLGASLCGVGVSAMAANVWAARGKCERLEVESSSLALGGWMGMKLGEKL